MATIKGGVRENEANKGRDSGHTKGVHSRNSSRVDPTTSESTTGHGHSAEVDNESEVNSLILLNVRGLVLNSNKSKLSQLENLAKLKNASLLCLTETWLNDTIDNPELSLPNMSLYRQDRNGRIRGDVATYVNSKLRTNVIVSGSDGTVEFLIVTIAQLDVVCVVVYRPPDSNLEQWKYAVNAIKRNIDEVQESQKFRNIMMIGDFNFPGVQWDEVNVGMTGDSQSQVTNQVRCLSEFMEEYNCIQVVNQCTRGPNILDLMIVNNPQLIFSQEVLVNAEFSDHNTLIMRLNCSFKRKKMKNDSKSIYETRIPKLRVSNATEDQWDEYMNKMENKLWFEVKNGKFSMKDKTNVLYKCIEEVASEIFEEKEER